MKYRIAMWAIAGFLVAGFWAIYFFPTASLAEPTWTLARVTCPVAMASTYLHFELHFYWAILANVATYALIGLTAETLRHPIHRAG
jgi:hypothetical protein